LSEVPVATPAVSGMLGMFIEETRELLQPCAALLAQLPGDPAAAAQLLHRTEALKESARLAGQDNLAEQARELERALHEAGPQLQKRLETGFSRLEADIGQLAGRHSQVVEDWTAAVAPVAQPVPEAPAALLASEHTLAQVR